MVVGRYDRQMNPAPAGAGSGREVIGSEKGIDQQQVVRFQWEISESEAPVNSASCGRGAGADEVCTLLLARLPATVPTAEAK